MQLNNSEAIYWLATSYLEGIGPITLRKCLDFFGDIKKLFSAVTTDLQTIGCNPRQMNSILNPPWKTIETDLKWLEQNACHLMTVVDEDYPSLLKEVVDAPLVLYIQGNPKVLNAPQIAIVGSRNPTVLGLEIAEEFAQAFIQAGLVVTSGLAIGIDSAGHRGALIAGGETVAVMGTGLNQLYPRSNLKLAQQIQAQGALVSEFAINTSPKPQHFPQRNRLISGLSLGLLVVEAALKSGSLITAHFAMEQGREVFAIPGSIHQPLSKGCHELIRQGAKLVESIEDILIELASLRDSISINVQRQGVPKIKPLGELTLSEEHLLRIIGYEPTALDPIVSRSGLTLNEVYSMLTALELKGYVRVVTGGYSRT